MLPTLLCLNFTLYIENSFKAKQAGLYNPTSPDSRPCFFVVLRGLGIVKHHDINIHKHGQSVLGIKHIFAFLSINYHDGCLSYDTGVSSASREPSSI